MNTVLSVYEELLALYKSVSASTSQAVLNELDISFGICYKIRRMRLPIVLREEVLSVLSKHTGLTTEMGYYASVPKSRDDYWSWGMSPIGKTLYKECIAPRVLLLEKIVLELEAAD